jgi:hypothetical protein
VIKGQNCELLADDLNILNEWKNHFRQLLNVHGINELRQTGMYTPELLVPESTCFDDEITTKKLKR